MGPDDLPDEHVSRRLRLQVEPDRVTVQTRPLPAAEVWVLAARTVGTMILVLAVGLGCVAVALMNGAPLDVMTNYAQTSLYILAGLMVVYALTVVARALSDTASSHRVPLVWSASRLDYRGRTLNWSAVETVEMTGGEHGYHVHLAHGDGTLTVPLRGHGPEEVLWILHALQARNAAASAGAEEIPEALAAMRRDGAAKVTS